MGKEGHELLEEPGRIAGAQEGTATGIRNERHDYVGSQSHHRDLTESYGVQHNRISNRIYYAPGRLVPINVTLDETTLVGRPSRNRMRRAYHKRQVTRREITELTDVPSFSGVDQIAPPDAEIELESEVLDLAIPIVGRDGCSCRCDDGLIRCQLERTLRINGHLSHFPRHRLSITQRMCGLRGNR